MTKNELNEKLKNVTSDEQLHLLLYKTKRKMKSLFHEGTIEKISVNGGYARYTYVDSNIKGYCKIENLHQYLRF